MVRYKSWVEHEQFDTLQTVPHGTTLKETVISLWEKRWIFDVALWTNGDKEFGTTTCQGLVVGAMALSQRFDLSAGAAIILTVSV